MPYFNNILDKEVRKEIIEDFKGVLAKVGRPHFLLGTGLSGTIAVSILHDAFDIPLMISRKASELTHGSKFEYYQPLFLNNDFIIVDDLVESGATVNRLLNEVKQMKCNVAALYLYNHFPAYNESKVEKCFWSFPTFYFKRKNK